MRKAFIITLVLIIFATGLYNHEPITFTNSKSQESIGNNLISKDNKLVSTIDPLMGETPLKANVLRGSMESYSGDYPAGWSVSGTAVSNSSYHYDGDAYEGTYSAYINAEGDEHYSSFSHIYQYPDSEININETKYLDTYYKLVSNPDPSSGSYAYIEIYLEPSFNIIYYILSGDPSLSNTSSQVVYNLTTPSSGWIHIRRNITNDAKEGFGSVDFTIDSYVLYVFCIKNPTGPVTLLADNFTIVNETGYNFVKNYNFEETSGWHKMWNSGPVSFGKDTNSVEGNYSFRMQCDKMGGAISSINVEKYFMVPYRYFTNNYGDLILEFDWWYNATQNGGGDQASYLIVYFGNSSYFLMIYYYLGVENGYYFSNSSGSSFQYIYINKTINNERATWHHTRIDFYDFFAEHPNIKNLYLQRFSFNTDSSTYENSTTTFLIDNVQLITDPVGNGEFEYHQSATFDSWATTNAKSTTDSISGLAMNLTASANDASALHTDMYMKISEHMFLMVGNKLSNANSDEYYAYITIRFTSGYTIYYVLSARGVTFTNTSNEIYIILNSTSSNWSYLKQDIYEDAQVFNITNYYITSISIKVHNPSSECVSLLIDNFYFIKDTHNPIVNSVTFSPSPPVYHIATTVIINISDLSELKVNFTYSSSAGNGTIVMTKVGDLFQAELPVLPYGPVSYYIRAIDIIGHETLYNNGGANCTFMIGDDIAPEVSITDPTNNAILHDNYTVKLVASDEASGVNYILLYLNDTQLANISAPYNYELVTRNYNNGLYTLRAVAYDFAGNSKETKITIHIRNDYNGPVFDDIHTSPTTPTYRDNITIFANVLDETNVSEVILYYNVGTTWSTLTMHAIDSVFHATIPAQPYGTTIQYYIVAKDYYGNIGTYGSASSPKIIHIVDDIDPVATISAPAEGSIVNGSVQIYINASDPDYPMSSGIDRIEIYIDGILINTTTQSPYLFIWNTTKFANGFHSIEIKIYDKAQNVISIVRNYSVQNSVETGTSGNVAQSFMFQMVFAISVGAVVILVIIRYILLHRKTSS